VGTSIHNVTRCCKNVTQASKPTNYNPQTNSCGAVNHRHIRRCLLVSKNRHGSVDGRENIVKRLPMCTYMCRSGARTSRQPSLFMSHVRSSGANYQTPKGRGSKPKGSKNASRWTESGVGSGWESAVSCPPESGIDLVTKRFRQKSY